MATKTKVAVIGDRFMRPEFFITDLTKEVPERLQCRGLELEWPDVPMRHGRMKGEREDLRDLKEYLGDPDRVVSFVDDAEILVTHLAPVSATMLAAMPTLRLIAVCRGGPVNIDMAGTRRFGVSVVNAPGRNASAVAEFTIGMIIDQTRLITQGHMALSQGMWRGDLYRADTTGDELCNLCVGLIGYGQIGTRMVKLLQPFGCTIMVCDPYVQIDDDDAAAGVQQVDLETLLRQADIVSLHARVTAETTGFLAKPQFMMMKRGAYFINTARGPMVNYDDLYQALKSGHLRGAGLETFAEEPPHVDLPLLRLPNVTLTPHIAGASLQTVKYAAHMIALEVRRYLDNQPFLNPC